MPTISTLSYNPSQANYDKHIRKAIKVGKVRKLKDYEATLPSNLLREWGEQKKNNLKMFCFSGVVFLVF